VITGGANGIGQSLCLRMAQEGARIVIADTDLRGAKRVSGQISSASGKSLAPRTDVSRVDRVDAMVRASVQEFGAIDALVNSAGVYRPKPALEVTEADLDRTLAVNLKGPSSVCSASRGTWSPGIAVRSSTSPPGWLDSARRIWWTTPRARAELM
jgi:NAD(P)-dependent dehydrogenase (short-subunit alcohol dehydrogenase family)